MNFKSISKKRANLRNEIDALKTKRENAKSKSEGINITTEIEKKKELYRFYGAMIKAIEKSESYAKKNN